MADNIITDELLNMIDVYGPCKIRRDAYRPGMPLSKVTYSDAVWVQRIAPEVAKVVLDKTGMELWTHTGEGRGCWIGRKCGEGRGDQYDYGSRANDGYGDNGEHGEGIGCEEYQIISRVNGGHHFLNYFLGEGAGSGLCDTYGTADLHGGGIGKPLDKF